METRKILFKFLIFILFICVFQTGCYQAQFKIHEDPVASQFPKMNIKVSGLSIANGGNYDFGITEVGFPKSLTFTIENTGGQDLNVSSGPSISGDSQFSITSMPSGGAIATGASQTFTVQFSPSVTQSYSASISISSNDQSAPVFQFSLAGSGTTASVSIINLKQGANDVSNGVNAHNFGTVGQNASLSPVVFTVSNSGSAVLNITSITSSNSSYVSVSSSLTTINSGANGTFSISLNTAIVNSGSATITILSNASNAASFTFTVTWNIVTNQTIVVKKSAAVISTGTQGHDFGTLNQNIPDQTVTFTIENSGGLPLSITSISSSNNTKLSISSSLSTIGAGASGTFNIVLSTAALGSDSATVTITSDASNTPSFTFTVNWNIIAVATIAVKKGDVNGTLLTTDTQVHDFGSLIQNSTSPNLTFTILNQGGATLNIVSITSNNASKLSVNSSLSTIASGANGAFTVTLSTATLGSDSATVTIASDANNISSFKLILVWSVVPAGNPKINIMEGANTITSGSLGYDFGVVNLGTASQVTITIQNTGGGTLSISSITSANGSFTVGSYPSSISGGSSGTFTVDLNVSTASNKSGSIIINSNDPNAATFTFNVIGNVIAVSGTGEIQVKQAATVIPKNGSFYLGSFSKTTSYPYTSFSFTIKNVGTSTLTISALSSNKETFDSDYGAFVTGGTKTGSISPGSTITFTVTFNYNTFSTVKTHSGIITINSNDPQDNPFTFTVTANLTN